MSVLLGQWPFVFVSGFFLLLSASIAAAELPKFEYLYFDWGQTPQRDNYQYALLRSALERSVPAYGEYRLARIHRAYTTRRSQVEVNLGRNINTLAGPWLKGELESRPPEQANLPVYIPILANLLGHRRLIIRREDQAIFQQLKTESQLRQLTLGQGFQWLDMDVYKHNGYPARDTAMIPDYLIPMLLQGRFDYIPMSVIEIDDLIGAAVDADAARVMEAANITVYYPFPVIFYVNRNQPALAERLQYGLAKLANDGRLNRLLKAHFSAAIAKLEQPENRLFTIENPYAPANIPSIF